MQNAPIHKIKLYSPEVFRTLLSHEVNKSRRYGDSLTLINLLVETDPIQPEAQLGAEAFTMNILSLRLRDADISSKRDNEFLILMPSTGTSGARTACARIQKVIPLEHQTDGVTFRLSTFIGMATLPIDHSISSDELSENASQALRHARANRLTNVVAFSEIPR
jgi:predicted signal transduction protein with EAL and GGDEF domain